MLRSESRGHASERLLLVGLHTAGSGLTSVGMSLASALGTYFEVGYVALERPDGSQHCSSAPPLAFVTRLPVYGPRFTVDPRELDSAVAAFDPAHILVIGPPFLAGPLLARLQKYRPERRMALYAAVEADLTDPVVLGVLRNADVILTYSEFTQRSILDLARRTGLSDRLPAIATAWHGISKPERFAPIARGDRSVMHRLRRQVFAGTPELTGDAFIVLNANRIYPRKRHDLSIEGFGLFQQRTAADAHLYLHALWIGDEERDDLRARAASAGVRDRVHLIARDASERPLSDDDLNALYNATDVGINTAMGEGWGLASFEHALTGAAQIVPAHTGLLEQWAGAAELVETVSRHPIFYEYGEMSAVSSQGVAQALERLYVDREHRVRLADAGRRNALSDKYAWTNVASRIASALRDPA